MTIREMAVLRDIVARLLPVRGRRTVLRGSLLALSYLGSMGGSVSLAESKGESPGRQGGGETVTRSELGRLLEERGFSIIADEVGTTGRRSSYHGEKMGSRQYARLPSFSPDRVDFGHGSAPSPGGEIGGWFDEGVLGFRIRDGELSIVVACGLDGRQWRRFRRHGNELFGQGDLFLDIAVKSDSDDDGGDRVVHYAMLNEMQGTRALGHGGWWDAAQAFRNGETEDSGRVVRVGELVRLESEAEVQGAGGVSGYRREKNSPDGLDERVFARGGHSMGVGRVAFDRIVAAQPLLVKKKQMTWFLTEWALPLSWFAELGSWLTDSRAADEHPGLEIRVAIHIATTCGNDQIGGLFVLPPTNATEGAASMHKEKNKKLLH